MSVNAAPLTGLSGKCQVYKTPTYPLRDFILVDELAHTDVAPAGWIALRSFNEIGDGQNRLYEVQESQSTDLYIG